MDTSFNVAGTHTYEIPVGYIANITVEAWGGGGGINGGTAARGGGGGGGYSTNTYTGVISGTYQIVVGAGGTSAAGGNSTYDFGQGVITAGGGQPGLGTGGGAGGVGQNANGGSGGNDDNTAGGGGGSAACGNPVGDGNQGGSANSGIPGAGAVGCSGNPGNDGHGGNGGASGASGLNGFQPGGGGGGKGNGGASNGNGATGRVRITVNSFTLPVKFNHISAINSNHINNINWSTSIEINNSHFEIERSTDGRNFLYLDRVEGNGNSNKTNLYEYSDKNPLDGINYYRLKQVDFDGRYEYSKIVSVNNKSKNIRSKSNAIIDSYGNVDLSDFERDEKLEISILDYSGRLLFHNSFNGGVVTNVSESIQPGLYLINLKNNQETLTQMWMKI
jgi:hypothetical protein